MLLDSSVQKLRTFESTYFGSEWSIKANTQVHHSLNLTSQAMNTKPRLQKQTANLFLGHVLRRKVRLGGMLSYYDLFVL